MTREQFYTYQEQTYDAFTKKVIKNKSIDIHREYSRQAKREISLSALSLADVNAQASISDVYRPYSKDYSVRNYTVRVYNPLIAELLQNLTPQRREVILLYYFLDLNDAEIGRLLQIDNTTAKYRRNAALRILREMLEEVEDE